MNNKQKLIDELNHLINLIFKNELNDKKINRILRIIERIKKNEK